MKSLKLSWTAQALIVLAGLLVLLIIFMTFERPPISTAQTGFRGTAMEQLQNPRIMRQLVAANQVPEALPEADGPIDDDDRASSIYENVQVLGDLSNAQFLRLMQAMTEWVVPRDVREAGNGCNYCHNPENLASDEVYTKVVTRSMLQMTRTINADWSAHVAETGVTCYTCHRGQAVPANVWASNTPNRAGLVGPHALSQNRAAASVNYSSLPFDPFTPFLLNDEEIRNISAHWHPRQNPVDVRQTEWTYALMIHMSQSIGVNCTFCHNSRSFSPWDQSPPQRVNAWHGIRMTRSVNQVYIEPLTPIFRENRLGHPDAPHPLRVGPQGDALKVNCATCHQGANRPLLGAPMLRDYPELNMVSREPVRTTQAAPEGEAPRN